MNRYLLISVVTIALPATAESLNRQYHDRYIPDAGTQAGQAGTISSEIQANPATGMSQWSRSTTNRYIEQQQIPPPSHHFQSHGQYDTRPSDVRSYREGYLDGSRSQRHQSNEALRAAIRACVVSSGHSYTACEARVLTSY